MKLHVETLFDEAPERVWAVFQDAEFERRLEAETALARQVTERREVGDEVHERVKCISKRELPRAMAAAIGSSQLTYDQINVYDRARWTIRWRVELPVLQDKVSVGGTTVLVPVGAGCRRVLDGEVSVRLPLVGGSIEKTIGEQFSRSYEKAGAIARELLRR